MGSKEVDYGVVLARFGAKRHSIDYAGQPMNKEKAPGALTRDFPGARMTRVPRATLCIPCLERRPNIVAHRLEGPDAREGVWISF